MPLFNWKFNNGFNGNSPRYNNGFGICGYNNNVGEFNNFANYGNAVNEMIKRNIETENTVSALSEEKKYQVSETIGNFIINERNSFLFYGYLRGICSYEKCRVILRKISDDCAMAQKIYSRVYFSFFEKEFVLKKSNINESVGFYDGVLWALEEECNSIFDISMFIGDFNEMSEKFSSIIQRKNARVGYLSYILNFIRKN